MSVSAPITQEPRGASGYLGITSLLLTLGTMGAVARRRIEVLWPMMRDEKRYDPSLAA